MGSVSFNPSDPADSISKWPTYPYIWFQSTHHSKLSKAQMIRDGTEGTADGPGYVQYLNGGSDYTYTNCNLGNPYSAARAVRFLSVWYHCNSVLTSFIPRSTTPGRAQLLAISTAPSMELPATSTILLTGSSAGTVMANRREPAASLPLVVHNLELAKESVDGYSQYSKNNTQPFQLGCN